MSDIINVTINENTKLTDTDGYADFQKKIITDLSDLSDKQIVAAINKSNFRTNKTKEALEWELHRRRSIRAAKKELRRNKVRREALRTSAEYVYQQAGKILGNSKK